MRAVDTNVIVRFLTGDEPDQFQRAIALIRRDRIHVSVTVLLEAEWVLRRAYRFEASDIIAKFRLLAGLSTVRLEDADRVAHALMLAEEGVDFADALHLARSPDCDDFVTFDQGMVKAARGKSAIAVVAL